MKTAASPNPFMKELDPLKESAARMERFIEEYLLDEAGLVRSFVNKDTLLPWTNDELKAAGYDFRILYRFERGKADGVLAYEDSIMATAEYGLARLEQYLATGEAVALASASWEVAALLRVLFEGEELAWWEKLMVLQPLYPKRWRLLRFECDHGQFVLDFANGAQDQTKRAVSENAKTLGFGTAEWGQ